MIFVINSTPLIYLCKAGLNWIFQELDADCIIPDSVYEEVVIRGKQIGSADAFVAEELVNNNVISVNKFQQLQRKHEIDAASRMQHSPQRTRRTQSSAAVFIKK